MNTKKSTKARKKTERPTPPADHPAVNYKAICELDKVLAAVDVATDAIIRCAPGNAELMAAQLCLRMAADTGSKLRDMLEGVES